MASIIEILFKTQAQKDFETQVYGFNQKRWEKGAFGRMININFTSLFIDKLRDLSIWQTQANLKLVVMALLATAVFVLGAVYNSPVALFSALIVFGYCLIVDKSNYSKEMFLRRHELAPVILAELKQMKGDIENQIVQLKKKEIGIIEDNLSEIKEHLSSDYNLKPFITICTDEQLRQYWDSIKKNQQNRITGMLRENKNSLVCLNDEITFLANLK